MTSKQQKKIKKRKDREKEIHKKYLLKKEKSLIALRHAKEDVLREKRIVKVQRDLERFNQVMTERELSELNDKKLSQLEKNIQILKALEEEYDRELAQKQKLNDDLENNGYYTLEEKLNAARSIVTSEENHEFSENS